MIPRAVLNTAAASIDLPPSLLPFAGEIFAGLSALGSTPRRTVNMLARAGIDRRHRIVDLGCGKGAVAVEAAARLGCRVFGIDAIETFIASARELARARGVGHLCRFTAADQSAASGHFDAALSIGVMPFDRASALCRTLLEPGGVYVLDDVVRLESVTPARGLGAPTQREARAILERRGDRVEQRVTPTPEETGRLNARLYVILERNATRLGEEHRRLRPALHAFLERQRDANKVLVGTLRPTLWLVRVR